MSILSIENLSKSYQNHQALKNVSLHIPKNHIYGLLGPNGAGKTSLIRIINQITGPDSGQILFDGEPLRQKHIAEIGYLPEERGLYPKMKVGEQLIYLARLKGLEKAEAKKRVKDWLERFEALSWWNKNVEELSKGMAQKVQFICTVLHEPRLLIFDEPFTGFDPINTNLIKNEIRRLRDQGATVIFSTHRMESVEEICENIALINRGELLLEGMLSQIKQEHKSGVYKAGLLNFSGNLDGLETLDRRQLSSHTEIRLTARENSNAILQKLMAQGQVIYFEEELPTLNEIFIQKVEES